MATCLRKSMPFWRYLEIDLERYFLGEVSYGSGDLIHAVWEIGRIFSRLWAKKRAHVRFSSKMGIVGCIESER